MHPDDSPLAIFVWGFLLANFHAVGFTIHRFHNTIDSPGISRRIGMHQLPLVKGFKWWHLYQWTTQPLAFLERWHRTYGDCFGVEIGSYRHMVFLSHPSAIAELFTANPDQFEVGRGNRILRPVMGDNSVLLLDGAAHARQRKLLMPPFHGDCMKAYSETICQITEHVSQSWQKDVTWTALPQMQAISLRVILKTVFGLDDGERFTQLKQKLSEFLEFTGFPFFFLVIALPSLQRSIGIRQVWQRFGEMLHQIDQLLYAEIRDRRDSFDPNRTDILSLLLSARDEAGAPMSDVELRDELITLLIAGHETTAIALSWALYWIHTVPGVKEKLQMDLRSLGSNANPAAIAQLPYLNAVCSETLRIYPVVQFAGPRIARKRMTIAGYNIAPETHLAASIYLVHRRPDLYPDPEQFKPERFLERQFSPYEFFPFGGGNRRCIGAAFAMYEMKLVLATLMQRYEFEVRERRAVVPIRRGVTFAPKGGVQIAVTQEL
jgi:unspecific monooxygenase